MFRRSRSGSLCKGSGGNARRRIRREENDRRIIARGCASTGRSHSRMTRQYGCRCAFQVGTVTLMQARPRAERPPLDLGKDLERAVERNEFGLEYQPIIDLQSGAIAAVEALLRWRHPLLGTIPPADYLPIAEENGLIVPIGRRVLETATRQLRTWHLGFARMQGLGMNINVAPQQLARPDFAVLVDEALEAAEISPVSLTLELSQGAADHLDMCMSLRDLGVNLAIEDFGAGTTLEDVRK